MPLADRLRKFQKLPGKPRFTAFATAAVAAAYALVVGGRSGFVPLWDGAWYLRFIETAIGQPFSIRNYATGHFAVTFFMLYGFVQKAVPFSLRALHGTSLALGLTGLLGYTALIKGVYKGLGHAVDRVLLAVIFAFFPVFLATAFNLTPDFTATMLYVAFLAALTARRFRLAVALGLFTTFSKEIGALMVLYTTVCYLVVFYLRHGRPVRRALPLFLPAIAYATYIVTFAMLPPGQAHPLAWTSLVQENPITIPKLILDVNLLDPMLQAYLADVFVLSFNWLLALPIAALLAVGSWRWIMGRAARPTDRAAADHFLLHCLLLAGAVYATSRYRSFNNPRYLMMCFTPLMLVSYGALVRLRRAPAIRSCYLAVASVLISASAFRTLDPVSKAIWGTFTFGEHETLATQSLNGGRAGRDELVYNLEYQYLDVLFGDVLEEIRPDSSTFILGPDRACFFFPGRIDAKTFRRTIARDGATELRMGCGFAAATSPAARTATRLYYVDIRNTPDPELLASLKDSLKMVEQKTVRSDGYALDFYRFERP